MQKKLNLYPQLIVLRDSISNPYHPNQQKAQITIQNQIYELKKKL